MCNGYWNLEQGKSVSIAVPLNPFKMLWVQEYRKLGQETRSITMAEISEIVEASCSRMPLKKAKSNHISRKCQKMEVEEKATSICLFGIRSLGKFHYKGISLKLKS